MGVVIARFDVFLVVLDPTIGSEIQKRLAPVGFPDAKSETRQTRPCLIISPDEMNLHLATAIVAPMTTKGKLYPSQIPVNFEGKDGYIVLDQIRTVDKTRLIKKLGSISIDAQKAVLNTLTEMFAED
ncbi:type II toxin-antitoxin system PemK/MazF family toxin [Chamaesiphon polymorphus]|uniref:Transcriptional regulator n=1 Tax=Chamaesiphon polymorphus CCALA 037 TaxID=2107692 RepID=A0A2T1G3W8_9CYAN|nr:type II toxin-antitoxin system PemK/MazF family toxin [Chamaesiphon polymorphus]PSB51937.1 transcriptional regulator [Chamaesiphon polymorphus CCALA 037]